VVCLVAFSAVSAGIGLGGLSAEAAQASLYQAAHALVWQIAGSLALGFLVGLVLATWSAHVSQEGEMMMLLAGAILFCVGTTHVLELSPLVASLGVGASVANLSVRPHGLFGALSRTDPPLYAIFFVIAGADLDLTLVLALGPLGAAYVLCRALGKLSGAFLGARLLGFPRSVQRNLGSALLSQAGLAIGLVLTVERRHPEYAALIAAVVLGAVVVFELVGPIGVRWAVLRSTTEPGAAALEAGRS
jgi:Kef-type K+ transport system membrane component KefB